MQHLSFLLFVLYTSPTFAEYSVIIHPSNNAAITEKDVSRLFLAKIKSFSDGRLAIPINQHESKTTRISFDNSILRKSPKQIKAYWSKLVFTGKATPLQEADSDANVVELVSNNATAIGYVSSANVSKDVKVLFTF